MAFCANCGAALADGAAFCAGCGKSVEKSNAAANPGTTPLATSTPPSATGAPAVPAGAAAASGLTPNMAGALAYVLGFITGIIFLVLEPYKNDRFVRFHAMQSIFYSVACIVFSIAWGIFWGMVFAVSSSLWLLIAPVRLLISLAMLLLALRDVPGLQQSRVSNPVYRGPGGETGWVKHPILLRVSSFSSHFSQTPGEVGRPHPSEASVAEFS